MQERQRKLRSGSWTVRGGRPASDDGTAEAAHSSAGERVSSAGSVPTVTLGLPVFNGQAFLEAAIGSLLAQTFADFELLIFDNASTDLTRTICEEYARRDSRIRYTRNGTNRGAAPNYNNLVAAARGRYFKWAAHDDRCHPEFLARCVEALEQTPGAVLCYPSTCVIDGHGKTLSIYRDGLDIRATHPYERFVTYLRRNFMRIQGMCNPIFGVIRTPALRRTRLIQSFPGSDRSLLGHLALLGGFAELPEVLFDRRVHGATSTMANASFSARRAWFDTTVAEAGARRRSHRDNHLTLRATHIRDFYRAIAELVDDASDRRRCYRALTTLLLTDPKWIYRDIKYSFGFHPPSRDIIRSFNGPDAS